MNAATVQVSELRFYALKSGKPTCITDPRYRLAVTAIGFAGDREFMLIDPSDNSGITQREHRTLCKVSVVPFPKSIVVSVNGAQKNFAVRTNGFRQPFIVTLFSEEVRVVEVDPAISRWVSTALGRPVRFVRRSKTYHRNSGFQDMGPFSLISEATIDDVIKQTGGSEIPRKSLRPNIIVDGVEAYGEDSWARIRIGEQGFTLEPCPRCVMPTFDQATGEAHPGINKILSTYRVRDYTKPGGGETKPKILLARYMRPLEPYTTVGVGDKVVVLSKEKT